MRSNLSKIVRSEFHKLMRENFPFFEKINKQEVISSGNILYRWSFADDKYFFIHLQIHKNEDWFTLNIASSKDKNLGTHDADMNLSYGSEFIRFNNIEKKRNEYTDHWFMTDSEREYKRAKDSKLKKIHGYKAKVPLHLKK